MRNKKDKKKQMLLIALSILFFTAVTGRNTAFADTAGTVGDKAEQGGLSAYISTDKSEYEAGETINFTVTVENGRLHSYTAKTTLSYTNTAGLLETAEGSIPTELAKIAYGDTLSLTGSLVGDVSVFPPQEIPENTGTGEVKTPDGENENEKNSGSISTSALIIGGSALAVCLIVVLFSVMGIRKKKNDKNGGKSGSTAIKAIALIVSGALFASLFGTVFEAKAEDYEKIVLRPYVNVIYAGQEVLIRATMELHAYQERVVIPKDHKASIKNFTCHDPSIIKGNDGVYYIVGTHITGGTSTDLIHWTEDTSIRTRFSSETIKKIREWNKDSGDWYGYLWAPDVVYNPVLGKYCYYLSANGDDWKSNIVMLTSDSPTGPFDYAGSVVYGGFTQEDMDQTDVPAVLGTDTLPDRYITKGIKNKKWGDKWPNCIDPCVFYDDDGKLWMSYGSWSGGIFLLELDENTGLRDYSVTYETNDHSDAYFGKKIAGGWYVSGEGSYIQKIGDYYWLFMSYGNLEAKGGYNIRVFRSKTPDGDYVDELGNSALYDKYIFNYNQNVGVRLFGGYKWRSFAQGQVAQGHNSALVDDDGRAYIVYHSRTTDGSEGHTVKIHQLFLNREGWLVAAPYYFSGEKTEKSVDMSAFAGDYEVIVHRLNIDYKNLDTNKPEFITLNADGTITGAYEGTWTIEKDSSYIYLEFNGDTYSGVALRQCVENSDIETDVFTALGTDSQITVWGSKTLELE
jgi:beta-xylosidase